MYTFVYRTVIYLLVFYECEAGYLTWRLEDRLRVFENRGLRKILGPKRDELTVEWSRVENTA